MCDGGMPSRPFKGRKPTLAVAQPEHASGSFQAAMAGSGNHATRTTPPVSLPPWRRTPRRPALHQAAPASTATSVAAVTQASAINVWGAGSTLVRGLLTWAPDRDRGCEYQQAHDDGQNAPGSGFGVGRWFPQHLR